MKLMSCCLLTAVLVIAGLGFGSSAYASDPTRPPAWMQQAPSVVPAVSQANFNLQQVLVRDDQRLAVINGELLREGQRISGAQVIEIKAAEVVLKTSQKRFVVSLLNNTRVIRETAGSRK